MDPTPELVNYFDADSKQIVKIPRRELRAGVIQIQIEGVDGLVWVHPADLSQGPTKHPPFEESVMVYVRKIHQTFEEHRGLTLEEWELGFRRDASPEQEIALWSYAADIYGKFTDEEISLARRREIYRCIVACLTTSRESVWDVLELDVLDKSEAEQIVSTFFKPPSDT